MTCSPFARSIGGVVGGEAGGPDGRARRGAETLREHGGGVVGELRVEHLPRCARRVTRCSGLVVAELDDRVGDHVDCHAERGPAGALADPGLQHPELALLDRELRVAHVAVVLLEAGEDVEELGVDGRELVSSAASGSVLRMPATTSSPWALTRKSP